MKPPQILEYFETRYISKGFMPLLSAVMKDKKLVVETGEEKQSKVRNPSDDDEERRKVLERYISKPPTDIVEKKIEEGVNLV